jgi:DNA-binding Lrp family transcriptional regulator
MEKKVKDVKNQDTCKNFYMSVVELIQEGHNPMQISKELNISRQRINYYISSLKSQGIIKKIGYGVWERCKNINIEDVKKSTWVANIKTDKSFTSLKQDSVRGHAFQITFQLPKDLLNWDKREEIFEKIGYKFKKINILGGGQSIVFKGRKIHLTNKSIIIYEKESFIKETAMESQSQAIEHFLKLIKQLERDLQANFSFGGRYRFKVTRQHYSLIKNALAKQYNDSGKKLEVYNDKGLWFLIDNSFNLNEAETIHSKTAVQDNEKVQGFFNGLKEGDLEQVQGFKPSVIFSMFGNQGKIINGMLQNANLYNENISSHIGAIKTLGTGVEKFNINLEIQNKISFELLQAIKEIKK